MPHVIDSGESACLRSLTRALQRVYLHSGVHRRPLLNASLMRRVVCVGAGAIANNRGMSIHKAGDFELRLPLAIIILSQRMHLGLICLLWHSFTLTTDLVSPYDTRTRV